MRAGRKETGRDGAPRGAIRPVRGPVQRLALGAMALACVLVLQMANLPRPLVGTVLNATFVVLTRVAGPWTAAALGALTPVGAFLCGLLPPYLLPMMPFVALGNGVIVLAYQAARRRHWAFRCLGPPAAKAAVIGLGAWFVAFAVGLSAELRPVLVFLVAIQAPTGVAGVLVAEAVIAWLGVDDEEKLPGDSSA